MLVRARPQTIQPASLVLAGLLLALFVSCKSGPTKEELKACDDAKATAVQRWMDFASALKAVPPDPMGQVGHDTVLEQYAKPGSKPEEVKLAGDVKAAEKSASDAVTAATSAAEALKDASSRQSAELVKLSEVARAAADKAKSEGDRARAARKAFADSMKVVGEDSKDPRIVELQRKRAEIGAELAKEVLWEQDYSKALPIAAQASDATKLVSAPCEKAEKK